MGETHSFTPGTWISPGRAQTTYGILGIEWFMDWTGVDYSQGKCATCCTISTAPYVLSLGMGKSMPRNAGSPGIYPQVLSDLKKWEMEASVGLTQALADMRHALYHLNNILSPRASWKILKIPASLFEHSLTKYSYSNTSFDANQSTSQPQQETRVNFHQGAVVLRSIYSLKYPQVFLKSLKFRPDIRPIKFDSVEQKLWNCTSTWMSRELVKTQIIQSYI